MAAIVFVVATAGVGWVGVHWALSDSDIAVTEEGPGWSREQVAHSMTRARRLIGACENFRRDHGRFPESIERLTPAYIGVIEPPATGYKQWKYFTYNSGKAFYLGFSSGSNHARTRSYASHRSPPWGRDASELSARARAGDDGG